MPKTKISLDTKLDRLQKSLDQSIKSQSSFQRSTENSFKSILAFRKSTEKSFQSIETSFRLIAQEFYRLNKRFDDQEQKLFDWKSELFNKIDSFMGRINSQDQEIAALSFRSSDHEERISKIESPLAQ